jgi:succinate dehydrogenase / fumarate reductase iron-sulfur subunit
VAQSIADRLAGEFGASTTCMTASSDPEGITITDNAIIPLKERVVDCFFDPVAKLLRD